MLYQSFSKFALAASVAVVFAFSPAQAEKISAGLKSELQGAMMDYIDYNSVEGKFLYLNAAQDRVIHYFPANLHPRILKIGDYFVLCSDFKTAEGANVDVDFLAIEAEGELRVIQALVGQRDVIRRMMKAQMASTN